VQRISVRGEVAAAQKMAERNGAATLSRFCLTVPFWV